MSRRIGILTGGGDAPGLNAVIRSAVLTAHNHYGWEVVGIMQGFDGLSKGLPVVPLSEAIVYDLLARGGTILGAANRGSPFARPKKRADGTIEYEDVSHIAISRMTELGLDAIIVAGGDGTMAIAYSLVKLGAHLVGVPKTIDNDIGGTDVSFGFDTAINTATEALDKLQTTAESHHRVMILEVMGRDAGWIALHAGVSGGADAILIPEIPFNVDVVCQRINQLKQSGRNHSLIIVAEGAAPVGGQKLFRTKADSKQGARLGGVGYVVGNMIADCVGSEVRVTVLGHVQRGGQPTPHDRWLATRYGAAGVHLVAQEKWGYMASLQGLHMAAVKMEDAIKMKFVDPDGELVRMARDLGVVFG